MTLKHYYSLNPRISKHIKIMVMCSTEVIEWSKLNSEPYKEEENCLELQLIS